jgi:hypothetical protein
MQPGDHDSPIVLEGVNTEWMPADAPVDLGEGDGNVMARTYRPAERK